MKYKIVAIKDMSAGNETVGEMWKETKIFDLDCPVIEIIKWVNEGEMRRTTRNLIITMTEVTDETN